jgi:hypothetical protein
MSEQQWPDRATTLFSAEPDGPAVIIYSDEEPALRADVQLHGNVYFTTDEHGIAVRIDPAMVSPASSGGT